jgi:hypothetical protein
MASLSETSGAPASVAVLPSANKKKTEPSVLTHSSKDQVIRCTRNFTVFEHYFRETANNLSCLCKMNDQFYLCLPGWKGEIYICVFCNKTNEMH